MRGLENEDTRVALVRKTTDITRPPLKECHGRPHQGYRELEHHLTGVVILHIEEMKDLDKDPHESRNGREEARYQVRGATGEEDILCHMIVGQEEWEKTGEEGFPLHRVDSFQTEEEI